MKQLFTTFYQLKERVSLDFIRYLYHEIRWDNRLIAITGARGTGKTTLMLQYIKEHYPGYGNEVLYVSLDNIWFTTHSLFELADEFQKMGGKALFLDEVHKYPTWSREIKNIYDSYPDIKKYSQDLPYWKYTKVKQTSQEELSPIICTAFLFVNSYNLNMDKNGSTYTSRHPDKTYRNSHEHKQTIETACGIQ